jgi:hypothetical protein
MEKAATAHVDRPHGSHEREPGKVDGAQPAADDAGSAPGGAELTPLADGEWIMTNYPPAGEIFLMIFRSSWPA